ncbi:hypothetical protein CY34DRAFT_27243 [Suillus luteus UH-Slu-Lm8-n1]|uniref:Uncharacterized protein n=1 Tax=Suillus luteus UH-Slu-Lm8-n1 TaxID=930992 RepID=A0A0D0A251_9AGAM|nr:hypothetical protein CY34DRAFT_27243 [Suillus luteus UH-Slu-Lm8-n1]
MSYPLLLPQVGHSVQTRSLNTHNFSTSIFYPEIRQAEPEDVLLQPLLVSVWFSGAVPWHLVHSNIPIEITVSLNEEYTLFTVPMIEISVVSDKYDYCSMSDDMPILFLPLPATFNHIDSYHWAELSGTIHIPLEGQFIKEWVGGSINLSAGDTNEDFTAPLMHADTLDFIWTEFSKHITLFYPYPLFSTT